MNRKAQTTPFHLLLLILLCAGLMVQCGDSNGTDPIIDPDPVDPDPLCDPSLLAGGDYEFWVQTVIDQCTPGILEGLIPRGPYVIDLPGFLDLPALFTLNVPPFVMGVEAELSVTDNTLRVDLLNPPITGNIDWMGYILSYEASIGTLCPVSPEDVDVSLVVDVLSVTPPLPLVINPPCRVVIQMTGSLP